MKAALASALLFATTVAHAASYNGDFWGGDHVTQADTYSDMFVFDDVKIVDPHVTTIWGNFTIYTQFPPPVSSLGLNYQIRTGVSAGNGGTLIASGSVRNLQQTPTGRSTPDYPEIQLLGTVDLTLTPGTYWLGLQNVTDPTKPQWTSFLTQTLGGDLGPSGDPNPVPQNAILDQSGFATGTEIGDYVQQNADYSIGVNAGPGTGPGPGPVPLPEPATAWLLGVGAMALFGLTRRRTRLDRGCSSALRS